MNMYFRQKGKNGNTLKARQIVVQLHLVDNDNGMIKEIFLLI